MYNDENEDYKQLLKLLAEKSLKKDGINSEDQEEPSMPMPQPEEEENIMIAQNREPAAKEIQGIHKDDVRMIQDLNMLDKINMRRQGLDPWNPDDIRKFKAGQG